MYHDSRPAGRALVRHVSYDSRSCLPAGGAPDCHMSCGPQDISIKKSLAGMPVQLGSHVPNARAYISKTPDVRTIMGM
jgi:hypothetical protein